MTITPLRPVPADNAVADELAEVKAVIADATEEELSQLNRLILVASIERHLEAIGRLVETGKGEARRPRLPAQQLGWYATGD